MALIAILVSVVILLIGFWFVRKNRGDLKKQSLIMTAAISLSITCLTFQYFQLSAHNTLFATLAAIRYGTQAITMNVNGDIAYSLNLSQPLFTIYSLLLSALYILGPLCASMFILGFSRSVVEYLRFRQKGHVHVFSELNERSVVIASSLYKKRPDSMRVFCQTENASEALKTKARASHSLLVRYDETKLRLRKKRKYHFYEIFDDHNLTLKRTAELVSVLNKQKKPVSATTRVFINHDQLEMVRNIDERINADGYNVRIRYIDENQAEATELFHHMMNTMQIGQKGYHYNLLIIGCGQCGLSIFRTAAWLMVLPESTYTIHLVDKNARTIASNLKEECPEFFNAPLEAYFTDDPTGKNYDIVFHDLDVKNAAFSDLLNTISVPDLIVVALKEDNLNHQIATKLCRIFASESDALSVPPLAARMRSKETSTLISGSAPIYYFGSIEKRYDYNNLIHPELEEAAKVVHRSYYRSNEWTPEIEHEFYRYVNYESSFGQALAMIARRRYILASKPSNIDSDAWIKEKLSDEKYLSFLGFAEHDRWNAYQRINGWRCASLEQTRVIAESTGGAKVKNDALLLHPAMVSCQELQKREEDIDSIRRQYNPEAKGVGYIQSDRYIVGCMPEILQSEPIEES